MPEALFMVFYWIQEVQKFVYLVDLVKSFKTSIYYLLAKFRVDTAENRPLKICQQSLAEKKLARNYKTLEKT